MLRSLKKPRLTEVRPTHVDLFVQNYDLLKGWAEHFSERDQELAGDLLHDTFIQFVLNRPDLSAIENVDGYLYTVMRNLHLSQMRRASRTPLRPLSVVEYDTVDVSLWASEARDRIRMREELMAVCRYACIRKETAKAASVLILRFFHGYYPEEISLVVRSNRSAVEKRLKSARVEARTYLENPDRLTFLNSPESKIKLQRCGAFSDLRLELRRQIFGSRQDECLGEATLRELYQIGPAEDSLDRQTIAHLVSCQSCLDTVNDELGLVDLASRYPLDTLGKDPGKKGGDGDGGGGRTTSGRSGAGRSKMLDSYERRLGAHLHHQPEELCISVNGQLQTFQKVVAGKGELTLIIDTQENLGFVEIFSEQGLRLLMLNVEPPPIGESKQTAHVDLSGGRTIDVTLNFGGPFPALQVTYNDPNEILASTPIADLSASSATTSGTERSAQRAATIGAISASEMQQRRAEKNAQPVRVWLKAFLSGWRSWLQPARLTAAVAALLILALIWFKLGPTPTISATELLRKSVAADEVRLAGRNRVLHRTLDLEEYDANSQLISRKKIDVWQSSEKGVTARRLYDDHGRLTAGDWRGASGVQTIYRHGEAAKPGPLPDNTKQAVSFDDAWQLSLNAKEFMALLGDVKAAQIETRSNDYVVTYKSPATVNAGGIITATITLTKEDLHALEETLTLSYAGEIRSYRMTEAAYEWRPANTVAPAVFQPNVELTNDKTEMRPPVLVPWVPPTTAGGDLSNTNAGPPAAATATAALELEVIEALSNRGAFTGEQIDVSRSGDKLIVTALVETVSRKQELLNALAIVKNNPAVHLQIETVTEAEARQARQTKSGTLSQRPGTVERFDAVAGTNHIYSELQKKFSDDEARRFVARVFSHSWEARSQALAINQLAGRFSAADLASLTRDERGRWLALIRGHAMHFLVESDALRRELQQVFPQAAGGVPSGDSLESDSELQADARELYDLSVAIDKNLNQALAITAAANSGAPLGSSFWRQFSDAARIARSLAEAK